MGTRSSPQLPPLTGTTAVVTGGNSGLGYQTAGALARAGADVVIGCRDPVRGEAAARSLQAEFGGQVRQSLLDLADLASVRAFASRLLASHRQLDLLVNNAGVMALPRRETTADGFERQMGTNHLGHFALTGLLWPALCASPAARVVHLGSLMAWFGRIDLDDLQSERRYSPIKAYMNSKLAVLACTLELDRRSRGTSVLSLAAHPGAAATDLGRHSYPRAVNLLLPSAEAGARPSLHAATTPDARGGDFFGPRWFGMLGAPHRARVPDQARDAATAARLWDLSEALTRVEFPADRR